LRRSGQNLLLILIIQNVLNDPDKNTATTVIFQGSEPKANLEAKLEPGYLQNNNQVLVHYLFTFTQK
jgi:hypothetical protein